MAQLQGPDMDERRVVFMSGEMAARVTVDALSRTPSAHVTTASV